MVDEHLANNDINAINVVIDLIKDEYGNYYEVNGIATADKKLKKVRLSQLYFEIAFQRIFIGDDVQKYKYKHIGSFLQDLVNGRINQCKEKNRKIFTVKELLDNGIDVEFLDQTVPHPRSLQGRN